jgi:hypothetical protein
MQTFQLHWRNEEITSRGGWVVEYLDDKLPVIERVIDYPFRQKRFEDIYLISQCRVYWHDVGQ